MNDYTVKCAANGLAVLFNQLSLNSDTHIEFTDPLCTVVKLGILAFKKTGTRFSIRSHTINIQDSWTFQGVQRWFNSDERDQLHHLRLPLLYFLGLVLEYIKLDHCDIDQKSLLYINDIAIKGLNELKITYETSKKTGSMVKNCLDDYIKTLLRPYTKEEYDKEVNNIGNPTLFVIYNEFMKKWTVKDCQLVISMFQLAEQKNSTNVQNEIGNAIDHFVTSKDLEIDALRPD
jgi:hypothetical protein